MAVSVISFPDRRADAQNPSTRHNGLRSRADDADLSQSSQDQAHRIVAQIEREITDQAYNRAQLRLAASTAETMETETSISVTGRILRAIKSLANCA